jgi:hypothetical protein
VTSFKAINTKGYAMAEAISRRPLTAEARIRSRVSPCVICGGQIGTGTGSSPRTSGFPCQFHSTAATLLGKVQNIIFIFIIGQEALRLRGVTKKMNAKGNKVGKISLKTFVKHLYSIFKS